MHFKSLTKAIQYPILAAVAVVGVVSEVSAQQLSGAGATFPAPLYQRWAVEYNKLKPEVQVNYQSVGSGAGIKNFTQGVVDFGASDAAMTDEQIAAVSQGVVLVPATAGAIVIAYNLPGVESLKLSQDALVNIFLGNIKKWNDPAVAESNPGVTLPDLPISVAVRSDGSGTTFVFTKYLDAISEDWKDEVGSDTSVTFPVGVGGKGNEGVTALIKQAPGSLGYIEYGYAIHNGLAMASLENKSGKFIVPSDETGSAALASVELPENLRIWPTNPEGENVYPITTFTWLLLYKSYPDAAKKQALIDFVTWGLTDGQKLAPELGYIALPEEVVAKCKAALATVE